MDLIKKISKYMPYIFYIPIMILSTAIFIKNFLFYQNQKQIEKINQRHYNEMEKQIKNLESNLTDLKISINEFLEKKQKQIKNLEIQKETNINKVKTNLNKNSVK